MREPGGPARDRVHPAQLGVDQRQDDDAEAADEPAVDGRCARHHRGVGQFARTFDHDDAGHCREITADVATGLAGASSLSDSTFTSRGGAAPATPGSMGGGGPGR